MSNTFLLRLGIANTPNVLFVKKLQSATDKEAVWYLSALLDTKMGVALAYKPAWMHSGTSTGSFPTYNSHLQDEGDKAYHRGLCLQNLIRSPLGPRGTDKYICF